MQMQSWSQAQGLFVSFGREFEGEGPRVDLFCEASRSWAVSWSQTAVLNEVPTMFACSDYECMRHGQRVSTRGWDSTNKSWE
jgi:hypothetical protein